MPLRHTHWLSRSGNRGTRPSYFMAIVKMDYSSLSAKTKRRKLVVSGMAPRPWPGERSKEPDHSNVLCCPWVLRMKAVVLLGAAVPVSHLVSPRGSQAHPRIPSLLETTCRATSAEPQFPPQGNQGGREIDTQDCSGQIG